MHFVCSWSLVTKPLFEDFKRSSTDKSAFAAGVEALAARGALSEGSSFAGITCESLRLSVFMLFFNTSSATQDHRHQRVHCSIPSGSHRMGALDCNQKLVWFGDHNYRFPFDRAVKLGDKYDSVGHDWRCCFSVCSGMQWPLTLCVGHIWESTKAFVAGRS